MMRRLTASLIAASLAGVPGARTLAQSPSATVDTSRALRIQYADGRVSTGPLRRSGGMWTPRFPRIAGADTSRDGIPLTTLDVKHAIDGADVTVTVSLFYGGPDKNGVKVATVRLTSEQPVQVTELRAYGVEPITLSLVPIEPVVAYAPEVAAVSGQLRVRAEAVGPNVSAYRVVIVNDSPLALMWVEFKAYRADTLAITGRPRGKRNEPLVLPKAEYSFEVTSSTGASRTGQGETWLPIDRIELTSMLWSDGLVEGDQQPAEQQRRVDVNHATEIRSLLTLLRNAHESSPGLRERVAQTMSFDIETRRARDAILADLDRFNAAPRTPNAVEFGQWLSKTRTDYEQWLARIVYPAGK